MATPRTCLDCPATLPPGNGRSSPRCDPCRKERNRRLDNAARSAKRAERRKLRPPKPPKPPKEPKVVRCRCGKTFAKLHSRQRHCSPECVRDARAEAERGRRAKRKRERPAKLRATEPDAPPVDTGTHLDPLAPLPRCQRCGTVGLCPPGCAAGRLRA